MKKKLLISSLLISLGIITLSSCGGKNNEYVMTYNNDNTVEYKKSISKGNNVNSITIDYYNTNTSSNDQLTITGSDTYKDVISKLNNANYLLEFGVKKLSNNMVSPFCETFELNSISEWKNMYENQLEKDKDGNYVPIRDKYSSGDIKTEYHIYANTTSYINDSFYNGSRAEYYKYDLNLKQGGGVLFNKTEDIDKGAYYNLVQNSDNYTVEFATNSKQNSLTTATEDGRKLIENYGSLYYKESLPNNVAKTYKAEKEDVVFGYNDFRTFKLNHQTYHQGSWYNIAKISNGILDEIPDKYKKYYTYTFELTDKYLILKNRIDMTESILLQAIRNDMNYNENELNEFLKEYEGSYREIEVWLDYKNIVKDNNNYYIGYDYFKDVIVNEQKNESVWSADHQSEITVNILKETNLLGKKRIINNINETCYETYVIGLDLNTINLKKEEFINKCKNNNFLDKYNFKVFATHYNPV